MCLSPFVYFSFEMAGGKDPIEYIRQLSEVTAGRGDRGDTNDTADRRKNLCSNFLTSK